MYYLNVEIMEEIWKTIEGYENLYEVSSYGRIKRVVSIKCRHSRILKQVINNGYHYVCLSKEGKAIRFAVHRIVAFAFIPCKNAKLHIDHIDGDRSNNNVTNLRWVTQKANNNNPVSRERYLQSHGRAIERIDISGNIKSYEYIIDAVEEGFDRSQIIKCCKGDTPIYRGFNWRYKGSTNKDNINISEELEKQKTYKKRIDGHTIERRKGNEVVIYESIKDAVKEGFSYASISNCCLYPDKWHTHKGYEWRYID